MRFCLGPRSAATRLPQRSRASALVLVFAALTGCREQVIAPSGRVALETNASTYAAVRNLGTVNGGQFALEMIVAVSNGTEGPVSLQACADGANGTPRFAVSMAATMNDWAAAYEDVNGCATPATITLAVGEGRVDRIELMAPRLVDASTGAPLGELEGRMRLVYYVDGLTLWSNAFEVRLDTLPR